MADLHLIQKRITTQGNTFISTSGGDAYGKIGAEGGFKTGNSVAVGTLGTATKKMPIYDMAGTFLGYIPIYN